MTYQENVEVVLQHYESEKFRLLYIDLDKAIMSKEIFNIIPEFPDYIISNFGNIKASEFNNKMKIMRPNILLEGYKRFILYRNGSSCNQQVAYFMLLAFSYRRPKRKDILHLDNDKLNNELSNLQWQYI